MLRRGVQTTRQRKSNGDDNPECHARLRCKPGLSFDGIGLGAAYALTVIENDRAISLATEVAREKRKRRRSY